MANSLFLARDFGQCQIYVNAKGETYLMWILTKKQRRLKGNKINWLTCFSRFDLCERHLERPHLTCVTCKILKVISGEMPLFYKINIKQIWEQTPKSVIRKRLFKDVLSLAEMLS